MKLLLTNFKSSDRTPPPNEHTYNYNGESMIDYFSNASISWILVRNFHCLMFITELNALMRKGKYFL